MKKNCFAFNKHGGFSIGQAIVTLVTVAVAVCTLTPVITRIIDNNPSVLKGINGWYESYNALPEGADYCKSCYDADHPENKNDKPSPWPDEFKYEKITKDQAGDPQYNPYAKDPEHDLVPYERYCKSNGKCGYPKDKWTEEELASATPPDEGKPHRCSGENGACSFKQYNNAKEYRLYAIGGGGSSGSAIKQTPGTSNLVGSALGNSSLPNTNEGSVDSLRKINANFIDVNRHTNPNESKLSGVINGTNVSEVLNPAKTIMASKHFYTVGDNKQNFHTYPTEATEEKGSPFTKPAYNQIKSKTGDENLAKKYYWYTRVVGTSEPKLVQYPEYASMPEWLSMDGSELRYPCTPKIDKECKPCEDKVIDIIDTTTVIKEFDAVVSIGCSGDGGAGATVHCQDNSKVCNWMVPDACPAGSLEKETLWGKSEIVSCTGCNYNGCVRHDSGPMYECASYDDAMRNCEEYSSECIQSCAYWDEHRNRKCNYNPYQDSYVTCTCKQINAGNRCQDNDDLYGPNGKCYNKMVTKTFNANSIDDMVEFSNILDKGYTQDRHIEVTSLLGIMLTTSAESLTKDGNRAFGENVTKSFLTLGAGSTHDKRAAMKKELSDLLVADGTLSVVDAQGGGSTSKSQCSRNGALAHRWAAGGNKGIGLCVYRTEIIEKGKEYTIKQKSTENKPNKGVEVINGAGCGKGSDGETADRAMACINGKCRYAGGGEGGEGGNVTGICPEDGTVITGSNGANGVASGTGEGGTFPKSQMMTAEQIKAGIKIPESEITTISTITHKVILCKDKEKKECYEGVVPAPGLYNWHYIWYMPFVTKHLMFGTAGSEGKELVNKRFEIMDTSLINIIPGKGAQAIDYRSGSNGKKGEDTIINFKPNPDDASWEKFTAPGGEGGLGSKKTDEYLLCNIADRQSTDPSKPCYYKDENDNDIKKTHKIEVDPKTGKETFTGLKALKYQEVASLKDVPMSDSLRKSNPGMGAMGYGTESVSDFVCQKRYLYKLDRVFNSQDATECHEGSGLGSVNCDVSEFGTKVLEQGGGNDSLCDGNAKIRYILPNGAKYSAGTGVVIITWK